MYYCELPGFHCNMLNIVNKASTFQSKAQPGGWNDLDMLEVGNGGMTDDEYVAHMSLWALMKSPLIMGNNLDKISAQSLSILMNPAVIAINQDPAGSSGQRVWRYDAPQDKYGRGEISLWTGSLANGDQVVALLNAGNSDMMMNATLEDIFIDGGSTYYSQAWDVYDLWANRMSNATAQALINGTSMTDSTLNGTQPLSNSTGYYNATQTTYANGLANNDTRLFGSMIDTVQAQGTLSAMIPRHGIGFYRLRVNPTATRKRDEL
jgi:alpha-galactosidase